MNYEKIQFEREIIDVVRSSFFFFNNNIFLFKMLVTFLLQKPKKITSGYVNIRRV
jgi:hypothetical protein